MKNTKKRKIIIPLFILLSFIIVGVTLAIILVNIPRTKIEDYEPPFTEYKVYVDGNKYTYYEEINGYLATNKIVVTTKNGKVINKKKRIKKYNEVIEINTAILANYSTIIQNWVTSPLGPPNFELIQYQVFYIPIDNKMMPYIGIEYHTYSDSFDAYNCIFFDLIEGKQSNLYILFKTLADEIKDLLSSKTTK